LHLSSEIVIPPFNLMRRRLIPPMASDRIFSARGGVMKWMRERDALLAQTLAFVQSVAGRKDDAGMAGFATAEPARTAEPVKTVEPAKTAQSAKPEMEAAKVRAAPAEPAKVADPQPAAPSPRPIVSSASEMQNEIRARVASFRAHQERFTREREQYFSATLARLRAAINELPPQRREK
jgi:hypothetical protein